MGIVDQGYALYDAAVERPAVARVAGRLMWGADTELFYGALKAPAQMPPGSTVLDVPVGGGVAFRFLSPEHGLRYIGVDLEKRMLDRARAEARRRRVDNVEFVQADVGALPVDDAGVDLVLTSAGLHCFPDPAAALAELARVLRPGGRLVGTMAIRGAGVRQDGIIRTFQRLGVFGPGGTADDYGRWARDAGLSEVRIDRSGAVARIDAVRPEEPGVTA